MPTMHVSMIGSARRKKHSAFPRLTLSFLASMTGAVATMDAQTPQKTEGPPATAPAAKAPGLRNRTEPGLEQFIELQDGSRLHGRLAEYGSKTISWSRPDAKTPIQIERSNLRRVILPPIDKPDPARAPDTSKLMATVKLAGASWLRGTLTSTDGENLALEIVPGQKIEITRSVVEWIHWDTKPAPALCTGGSLVDLTPWLPGNSQLVPRPRIEAGFVRISDQKAPGESAGHPQLVGFNRSAMFHNRMEFSMDLPAAAFQEADSTNQIWFSPEEGSIPMLGTMTFTIRGIIGKGQKGILMISQTIAREESAGGPIENSGNGQVTASANGSVQCRFLVDTTARKLTVLANGTRLAQWDFPFKGFAGDVQSAFKSAGFALSCGEFGEVRLQPWDGILEGHAVAGERISTAGTPPVAGRLETVSENSVTFAGKMLPLAPGVFLQTDNHPAGVQGAELFLDLGEKGQVCAAEMAVVDGRVSARIPGGAALAIPLPAIQAILFSPRMTTASDSSLRFRNGDELHGTPVAVAIPGNVRWKDRGDRVIEFTDTNIAGVRFPGPPKAQTGAGSGSVELRNGDQLRGELVSLDDRQATVNIAAIGSRTFDRKHLWNLHLFPGLRPMDASSLPADWTAPRDEPNGEKRLSFPNLETLPASLQGGESTVPITRPMRQFELRCTVRNIDSGFGAWIGLGNRESKPGEGTSFSLAFDPGACATEASTGQRSITKEFNLPPLSITNPDGIKVRIFVDSGAGSFHVFANGVLAAQIGKSRAESDIHKGVFDMVTFTGGKSAFSGLWIGPWNGEFPTPENLAVPSAMLRSGDLIPAAPSMFKDGKFHFETKELGRLEFPADRAQWLTFAGAPDTAQAQALMRTGDGQAIHCEEFHIEGGEVVALSAALGEIRMPLKDLKELIRKPSPPVAPPSVSLKNLSSKPPTGPPAAIPPDAI